MVPNRGRNWDIAQLALQLIQMVEAAVRADANQFAAQLVIGDFRYENVMSKSSTKSPCPYVAIFARVANLTQYACVE